MAEIISKREGSCSAAVVLARRRDDNTVKVREISVWKRADLDSNSTPAEKNYRGQGDGLSGSWCVRTPDAFDGFQFDWGQ